jgi:hypothetical protein
MHMVYGAQAGNPGAADGQWFDAVIPNQIEDGLYDLPRERGDYALYVGRITDRKGYRIAQEVCQAKGLDLILAGPGGRSGKGYGRFVGEVDAATRATLMAGARCLFAPTIYVEPFGTVTIEAMACGTPVICTDWGAFTETVEHGRPRLPLPVLRRVLQCSRLRSGAQPRAHPRRRAPPLFHGDGRRAVRALFQPPRHAVRQGLVSGGSVMLLTALPFWKPKSGPFIAAIGTVAKGSGNAVSVSPPAGAQAGDLLLCIVGTENGGQTAPSGYSELSNSPQGNGTFATSTRLGVFSKVHSGSESAVTVGLFGSHTIAVIIAIRNANTTINVNTGSNSGSSTSVSCPTATTTVDGCLVLAIVAFSNATTVGSWANANLADFAEILDDNTTDDDDGGFAIAAGYKVTAGATGATTATLASASTQGRMTIGIAPGLTGNPQPERKRPWHGGLHAALRRCARRSTRCLRTARRRATAPSAMQRIRRARPTTIRTAAASCGRWT